jgi:hypothetical protein
LCFAAVVLAWTFDVNSSAALVLVSTGRFCFPARNGPLLPAVNSRAFLEVKVFAVMAVLSASIAPSCSAVLSRGILRRRECSLGLRLSGRALPYASSFARVNDRLRCIKGDNENSGDTDISIVDGSSVSIFALVLSIRSGWEAGARLSSSLRLLASSDADCSLELGATLSSGLLLWSLVADLTPVPLNINLSRSAIRGVVAIAEMGEEPALGVFWVVLAGFAPAGLIGSELAEGVAPPLDGARSYSWSVVCPRGLLMVGPPYCRVTLFACSGLASPCCLCGICFPLWPRDFLVAL